VTGNHSFTAVQFRIEQGELLFQREPGHSGCRDSTAESFADTATGRPTLNPADLATYDGIRTARLFPPYWLPAVFRAAGSGFRGIISGAFASCATTLAITAEA
jgi:hypothetical protein